MIKQLFLLIGCCLFTAAGCGEKDTSGDPEPSDGSLSDRNLQRAIQLVDEAVTNHFTGAGMAMARYYNPYTGTRSTETGSVWMYTSSIEAVNAILHGLKAQKDQGSSTLYDQHFNRYTELLSKLYDGADYYLGTFTLTSYTQTKSWNVYGVNRGSAKGAAKVEGIENVYDDQMWLIRELVESYKLTGTNAYLEKAEYLTAYVLDGWDCAFDSQGNENGGITWGPGYTTKHACSNGPMISPLVWLHELYKGKSDQIEHRYIDPADKKTRKTEMQKKSDYYLAFAEKTYNWQKQWLLRSDGVYNDMMGGCDPGEPQTETINGVSYRKGITCRDRVGPAISYNSGTMLSGAADLYRVTNTAQYLTDAKALSESSFTYFASKEAAKPGCYTYDLSGFRNWFNGVLMRGYTELYPAYKNVESCIDSFQQNLDYGYTNYFYKNMLPPNLLVGWNPDKGKNNMEGMFTFAFAAEYAVLARYELEK